MSLIIAVHIPNYQEYLEVCEGCDIEVECTTNESIQFWRYDSSSVVRFDETSQINGTEIERGIFSFMLNSSSNGNITSLAKATNVSQMANDTILTCQDFNNLLSVTIIIKGKRGINAHIFGINILSKVKMIYIC